MPTDRKISVIGLGYVGLPVAVAFGKSARVVGFDINPARIAELKAGEDSTHEVDPGDLKSSDILFTSEPADLSQADFHIVAVPTPVDEFHTPDLTPLIRASETLAPQVKRGDIVVYESTVYPGVTEEVCLPILEAGSDLKGGSDFKVGYSPERINPGDKEHTFTKIMKVVSGQDSESLKVVSKVYASVVQAGVFEAASIKVAEAAKVIENTQRDLNIALMNELAVLFHRLGIDTQDVLAAARTKWNFLPFSPGLVGGHCIGVDPYYLTHVAEKNGHHPQVILAGRRINDDMGRFVVRETILRLAKLGIPIHGSMVTVLGLTFKEDVPDLRNSKVIDIIDGLKEYGLNVQVHDPLADPEEAMEEYGVGLVTWENLKPASAVVLTVAHQSYREGGWDRIRQLLDHQGVLVVDVRGMLEPAKVPEGIDLWRL